MNQNETPDCRICQGETVYIGTLGSSLFYRCRHCGIETFTKTGGASPPPTTEQDHEPKRNNEPKLNPKPKLEP